MTTISSMRTYMYCPRKLYIQENIIQGQIKIHPIYNELKTLKNDLQIILSNNMRKIKKEMDLESIEKILTSKIPTTIETTFNEIVVDDIKLSDEEIDKLYENINNQIYYDIQILTFKTKKAMEILKQDGSSISGMFFPSAMYSYYIKDDKLDLIGVCDKIEIVDGVYYPIIFKNNTPPIRGVWHQDAVELATQALLIEREFDKDVFTGFVEYQKIGERRPVIMDSNIRKEIFKLLQDIEQLTKYDQAPQVKINENKCNICEYKDICLEKKI